MSIFASSYLQTATAANPANQFINKIIAEKEKKQIPIETIKLQQVQEKVKEAQTVLEQTKQEAAITENKAEETKQLAELTFNKGIEEALKPKTTPTPTTSTPNKSNQNVFIIVGVIITFFIVLGAIIYKKYGKQQR